jgi:hypothetical protein
VSRPIGPACDFYRLRVTRIDAGGDVEFDWRDDVLWRSAPPDSMPESDIWVLEAVTLDAQEFVTPIAVFPDADEAREALVEATEDLDEMTRAEFEAEYLHDLADDDGKPAES